MKTNNITNELNELLLKFKRYKPLIEKTMKHYAVPDETIDEVKSRIDTVNTNLMGIIYYLDMITCVDNVKI